MTLATKSLFRSPFDRIQTDHVFYKRNKPVVLATEKETTPWEKKK